MTQLLKTAGIKFESNGSLETTHMQKRASCKGVRGHYRNRAKNLCSSLR